MRFQTVAYVRVFSADQHTDRQVTAVDVVDRMFTDYLSGGSREERVALVEMLDYVRDGDTVRVASMDRLARSVIDLAQLVGQCTDKGVSVEFVGEGLTFTKDADNPYAMFQLHMLGAVAQLERSLIRERQRQGIAIARAKSTYKGRLPVLNGEQIATARASLALKVPKAQIARDLGVSRSALYDALGSRGAYARSSNTADPVRQAPPVPPMPCKAPPPSWWRCRRQSAMSRLSQWVMWLWQRVDRVNRPGSFPHQPRGRRLRRRSHGRHGRVRSGGSWSRLPRVRRMTWRLRW